MKPETPTALVSILNSLANIRDHRRQNATVAEFASDNPEHVATLLSQLIRLDDGKVPTPPVHAAAAFLPMTDWPRVVVDACDHFVKTRTRNAAVDRLIDEGFQQNAAVVIPLIEGYVTAKSEIDDFFSEDSYLKFARKQIDGKPKWHARFDSNYLERHAARTGRSPFHPTWRLPANDETYTFGGRGEAACTHCDQQLTRLIDLDPVPKFLPITGMNRLELAYCPWWVHGTRSWPSYRHDGSGAAIPAEYHGPVDGSAESAYIRESQIRMSPTPRRWCNQSWTDDANTCWFAGCPNWVQADETPTCTECGETMSFLMQVGDDAEPERDTGWALLPGDVAYAFWCDDCKISSVMSQFT